jgi:PII-like signaling protein
MIMKIMKHTHIEGNHIMENTFKIYEPNTYGMKSPIVVEITNYEEQLKELINTYSDQHIIQWKTHWVETVEDIKCWMEV